MTVLSGVVQQQEDFREGDGWLGDGRVGLDAEAEAVPGVMPGEWKTVAGGEDDGRIVVEHDFEAISVKLTNRERRRGLGGADIDRVDLKLLADSAMSDVAIEIADGSAVVVVAEGVDEGTACGANVVKVFT